MGFSNVRAVDPVAKHAAIKPHRVQGDPRALNTEHTHDRLRKQAPVGHGTARHDEAQGVHRWKRRACEMMKGPSA